MSSLDVKKIELHQFLSIYSHQMQQLLIENKKATKTKKYKEYTKQYNLYKANNYDVWFDM